MQVKMIIDGEELDLNDFAERVVFGVGQGLIEQLRDTEGWSRAEIVLER